MAAGSEDEKGSAAPEGREHSSNVSLAVALAAVAALGVCFAIQQILERRLSKPAVARLKFYKYLRERGRLDS